MRYYKDQAGKVYKVVDEKLFFEYNPDLFVRRMTVKEIQKYEARA